MSDSDPNPSITLPSESPESIILPTIPDITDQTNIHSCICSIQGRRNNMEDTHSVYEHPYINNNINDNNINDSIYRSYYSIYDGHGGTSCSEYLKKYLYNNIINNKNYINNHEISLLEGIEKTDLDFLDFSTNNKAISNSGSTIVLCSIIGNKLYTANVGDSRAILCTNGLAKFLSNDHKPDRPDERDRIISCGGAVARTPAEARYNMLNPLNKLILNVCCCDGGPLPYDGPMRLFPGGIAVSRSVGDFDIRKINKALSPLPEIIIHEITSVDEFIILACDGLWDVMSNQEACDLVLGCNNIKEAAKKLCSHAFERGSCDNISVIVIFLREPYSLPSNITNLALRSALNRYYKKISPFLNMI